ncbi:MAG: carbohydrate kinase family protein [Parcubacteria group bacterium]|nr:carbohydrate kinase family protein [Parcubacteria group bacterium]
MYDIITIGTATRDVFLKSPAFKILRDPSFATGQAECFALGSKIEAPEIYFTTGGGATNAAVTFSRQGLKTACLTKVGNDPNGKEIIQELKSEGVSVFVKQEKRGGTAYSVILMAPGGERTILVHRGVSEKISPSDFSLNSIKTRWVYLAPLGGKNVRLFKPLVDYFYKNKIKIAVNPSGAQIKMGVKKLIPILKKIDVFILNQEEAGYLTGVDFKKEQKIFKKLDDLITPGIAVMTKGRDGVSVSDGKHIWQAGILKEKKLVDRTGAGDAFGSGFVASLIKKDNIEDAIQLGSANATSKLESIGAKNGLLKKNESIYKWGKLKIKKI